MNQKPKVMVRCVLKSVYLTCPLVEYWWLQQRQFRAWWGRDLFQRQERIWAKPSTADPGNNDEVGDAKTLTIKNQNITLELALQIHSAASWYSSNCKSCNTVVFIEKISVYKWTHPCRSHPCCSRVNRTDSDRAVMVREGPGVKE